MIVKQFIAYIFGLAGFPDDEWSIPVFMANIILIALHCCSDGN